MNEPNVPQDLELSQLSIESYIEKYKVVLAGNKELSNALNKIRENYVKELHDLIGSKVNEYLAFRQKIRDRARDIRSGYRSTPEGEKIRSESERKLLAKGREFINSLGVDSRNVKNVQKKYLAQSRSAVEKAMNIMAAPYVPVTSTKFPKRTSMAGWTVKNPPYDSSWGSESRFGSGGTRWMSHFEEKDTGKIECRSMMELYDASDYEHSITDAYSEMLIWFQMPVAGYVETWFTLQCIETPYSGCLRDEVGWSNADIQQFSDCYLGSSQPQGGRVSAPLRHYERGDAEGCWSGTAALPGEHKIFNLTYHDQRFKAGQWVLMAIGIHDFNFAAANDMSFDTMMTSRWIVTEVLLRSTGSRK